MTKSEESSYRASLIIIAGFKIGYWEPRIDFDWIRNVLSDLEGDESLNEYLENFRESGYRHADALRLMSYIKSNHSPIDISKN